MVQTLEALFDGETLHLDEPLAFEPNTRVRLVIETVSPEKPQSASFLRTARALKLEGPEDWATNVDSHLYGEDAQRGS